MVPVHQHSGPTVPDMGCLMADGAIHGFEEALVLAVVLAVAGAEAAAEADLAAGNIRRILILKGIDYAKR